MAASRRARALCRRCAAADDAARPPLSPTLNIGCPDLFRSLMPRRANGGNLLSIKPSRALPDALIVAWGIWPNPRCQSHHCLNAMRGAAAEGVAQVETGHGEPVGKTHSSERGQRLARQLKLGMCARCHGSDGLECGVLLGRSSRGTDFAVERRGAMKRRISGP